MSAAETVDYVSKAAEGLDVLHRMRIVHRDVKTPNLLHGKTLWVADFGSATTEGSETKGVITPSFAAPELLRRKGKATVRSDVYSLGVVAAEALSGAPPFRRIEPRDYVRVVLSEDYPNLMKESTKGLPAPMVAPVRKAMAQDPKDRYASVGELAEALKKGLLEAQASAARGGVVYDMRRPVNPQYMPRIKPTAAISR